METFHFGCAEHLRMFPSAFFSVWRPTSADALRLLVLRQGVGKGLNVKGKSAKRGVLSGFVPFLQASPAGIVPHPYSPPRTVHLA